MAQAPAADQRRLLDVQDADTRIAQATHRRAHLPVVAQLEELKARHQDLDRARALIAVEVSDIKRDVAKAEDDVLAVRARADRDSARLNSGQGTPKELQALQAELEALAKRQGDLEDVELEAMGRLEDAETRLASTLTQVEAISSQIRELEQTVAQEQEGIDRELADLAADRHHAAAGIDADLVALYERLRTANGGVGAAALVGGQCQGCHMSLNTADLSRINAAAADEVVRCEECGRILVRGASA